MFMVINKDKIISYLVSFSTVALLFVMSVAISNKNDEILHTSANRIIESNQNVIEINVMNSINERNEIGEN